MKLRRNNVSFLTLIREHNGDHFIVAEVEEILTFGRVPKEIFVVVRRESIPLHRGEPFLIFLHPTGVMLGDGGRTVEEALISAKNELSRHTDEEAQQAIKNAYYFEPEIKDWFREKTGTRIKAKKRRYI